MPATTEVRPTPAKARIVLFVLIGVAGLLFRGRYNGPWNETVHSYGGNLAVSFALYFLFTILFLRRGFGRLFAAGAALAVVQLFEALDGFGFMRNVYDPLDFAANAVGVGLGLLVDRVTSK